MMMMSCETSTKVQLYEILHGSYSDALTVKPVHFSHVSSKKRQRIYTWNFILFRLFTSLQLSSRNIIFFLLRGPNNVEIFTFKLGNNSCVYELKSPIFSMDFGLLKILSSDRRLSCCCLLSCSPWLWLPGRGSMSLDSCDWSIYSDDGSEVTAVWPHWQRFIVTVEWLLCLFGL